MDRLSIIQDVFAKRLFQVPDYQRGYAWEVQQLDDFVQDLELLAEGKEHFFGTLILHAPEDRPKARDEDRKTYLVCDVVDGQQRLTTVVLLLDAIRREIERMDESDTLASSLRRTYIAVNDLNHQLLPKLRLNRDCQGFFQNAVLGLGQDIEGPKIRSHRFLDTARGYFTDYLKRRSEKLGSAYADWLVSLYDRITQQLTLLVYEVGSEAEAGVIFETMNNRGKQITELEKVKNYLLFLSSKLDLDAEHSLVGDINETWTHIFEHLMAAGLGSEDYEDQLLRAHWLMAYDHQAKNWQGSRSIKDRFNLRAYRKRHPELLQDLQDYLNTLHNSATAYCDIFRPTHSSAFNAFKSDARLHDQLVATSRKLARLGALATFLPLLIAVRLKLPDDGEAYLDMASLCEKFAFRVYRWRRWRSDTGRSQLYRLGYELFEGSDFESILNKLRRTLLRYCTDEQFRSGFRLAEENNWFRWSGLKYFLYEYEEHLAQVEGVQVRMPWSKVARGSREDTVEHILPQHPEEGGYWTEHFSPKARRLYTHDIGNLCLTYYNPKLGRKPFKEKKGKPGEAVGYVNSLLLTEKQLAKYEDWTETELLARRKEIEAWALKRWHVEPPPPLSKPTTKLDAVRALAENYGLGEELELILETAARHQLYPRPEKRCVWYTPPSRRTHALFTVWPKAGRLSVGVWWGNFSKFFDVTEEQMKSILGPNQWHSLTASNVGDFTANLDHLFDQIEKKQGQ